MRYASESSQDSHIVSVYQVTPRIIPIEDGAERYVSNFSFAELVPKVAARVSSDAPTAIWELVAIENRLI